MPNPFDGARLKINRAKHHIQELTVMISAFQAENPYEIVIEEDPEPGYKVHELRLTNPDILLDFGIVIGDALNNMRTALDHATYACAIANWPIPPNKWKTCSFPFGGDDSTSLDNAVKGCTAIPEDIRTLLRTFQAYKNGDIHLWALNKMCNLDKHALITPVLVGWDTVHVLVTNDATIHSPKNPFWDNAKAEIELFRTRTDPQYDFTISLDIALHGPDAISPNRADGLLNGFLWSVESVVGAMEREMIRLGFVN